MNKYDPIINYSITPFEAFELLDDEIEQLNENGGNPFMTDELWNAWERLRDFFNLEFYQLDYKHYKEVNNG